MENTELWNKARKLNLGTDFLNGLDELLTSLESDNKQLIITDVVKEFTAKDTRSYREWVEDECIDLKSDGKLIYKEKIYSEEEIWQKWYYNNL